MKNVKLKKLISHITAVSCTIGIISAFSVSPVNVSATGENISIEKIELTLSELQNLNYEVTVTASINGNNDGFSEIAFGTYIDEKLKLLNYASTGNLVSSNPFDLGGYNESINLLWLGCLIQLDIFTMEQQYVENDGSIYNLSVTVPQDAKVGDIFYIKFVETNPNGNTSSITTRSQKNQHLTGSDGYIKIVDDTSKLKGNVNNDSEINVDDASFVLNIYAKTAAGLNPKITEEQKIAADVNNDSNIDVDDASLILNYYAKNAAGIPTTWADLIS